MATLKDKIKKYVLAKAGIDAKLVNQIFEGSNTVEQLQVKLQDKGILSEEEYCSFLAKELSIAYFDLASFKFDRSNADIIPQQLPELCLSGVRVDIQVAIRR